MIVGGNFTKRYRLGPSSTCDAANASRSLRSSRTTAASAVGLTCVARVGRGARVSHIYTRTAGTHALVAEPREDLERGSAEIRVQQVTHFLHGCVGVRVERWNAGGRARTIESGCWQAFICVRTPHPGP